MIKMPSGPRGSAAVAGIPFGVLFLLATAHTPGTPNRVNDLDTPQFTFEINSTLDNAMRVLTDATGIRFHLELPPDLTVLPQDRVTAAFASASAREILDEACEDIGRDTTWSVYVWQGRCAAVIHPRVDAESFLSIPMDCTELADATLEEIVAAALPLQLAEIIAQVPGSVMAFSARAEGDLSPHEYRLPEFDRTANISALETGRLRMALAVALMQIEDEVPLLYRTAWSTHDMLLSLMQGQHYNTAVESEDSIGLTPGKQWIFIREANFIPQYVPQQTIPAPNEIAPAP
jgi:hypothetical protein